MCSPSLNISYPFHITQLGFIKNISRIFKVYLFGSFWNPKDFFFQPRCGNYCKSVFGWQSYQHECGGWESSLDSEPWERSSVSSPAGQLHGLTEVSAGNQSLHLYCKLTTFFWNGPESNCLRLPRSGMVSVEYSTLLLLVLSLPWTTQIQVVGWFCSPYLSLPTPDLCK